VKRQRPLVIRAPGEKVAARILPVRPIDASPGHIAYARAKFGAVEFEVPLYAGDSPEVIGQRIIKELRSRNLPERSPDASLPECRSPEPARPSRRK